MIAFFHQNDIFGRQGGVERYLATLVDEAADEAAMIGPPLTSTARHHFTIHAPHLTRAPAWLGFVLGVVRQQRALRSFLGDMKVGVLEFSRPEYVLIAWLFAGRRVFTIHGTGPSIRDWPHYVVHHVCCCLTALVAERVQIVGRDCSGLSRLARWLLRARIRHIDAWYDDRFCPAPLPALDGAPLKVFYAGRMAAQKNPELLFAIIRQAAAAGYDFEFHYFGSDYHAFETAGLADCVRNHGLLSPPQLAQAIGACHAGLLCSGFGEGSPFIVVETLACGRAFVLPPLPTLVETYAGMAGITIVNRYELQAFIKALESVRRNLSSGRLAPNDIAAAVAPRSQKRATRILLDSLSTLAA